MDNLNQGNIWIMDYCKLANALHPDEGRGYHFVNLNMYNDPLLKVNPRLMVGKYWEITEKIYNEFLEVLPPRYVPGGFGIIEMLTDDITCFYFKVGSRYWAGYAHARTGAERGYRDLIDHIKLTEV